MLPNVLHRSATDHVPVLADEVRELLAVQPGETVVDGTFGAGGHAATLAAELHGEGKLIAIDRDPGVRPYFDRFKAGTGVQARLLRGEFSLVLNQLAANDVRADAILLDLGVSSMQLDIADRGFSYSQDAPLDMRMNPDDELTAALVLNTYSALEITRVLRHYGEEKFAKRIADAVVAQRAIEPFTTSARLVDLIRGSIPQAARRSGGNPAKRTFQALRIEVNDELGALTRALPASLDTLEVGGRVVALAYHSLEDRLVKQAFARVTKNNAPRDLPIVPVHMLPKFKLVTRGSEQAAEAEIADNRRAQSVRLRAVERIAA